MATDNIREWGKQNGWDVADTGRMPPGLREAWRDSRDGSPTGEDGFIDETVDDDSIQERAPEIVKPSARQRVQDMVSRAREQQAPRKAVRGKVLAKPRVSVEKLISGAWSFMSQAVQSFHPPVSRVLEMQAPVAGMILEDVVRNSIADRLLQPLARGMNGGEVAFALMGPPLLIAALSARPDKQAILVPMLRQSLRSWIDLAGDKLEQIQRQDNEFQDKYGKRIDEMIEYFLEPLRVPDGGYPE